MSRLSATRLRFLNLHPLISCPYSCLAVLSRLCIVNSTTFILTSNFDTFLGHPNEFVLGLPQRVFFRLD